ncbi:GNAT family N-acetyltransferase [Aquimarina sp. 2201CG1-2-11]|uniref:GNAT family N-acetyltransferase n=1 Tax=Aquimarina discodermiae TaxID=3231043 RepID=UPI0034622CCF
MIVKSLENIDFKVLIECFLEAFENYYVKMPTDHEYYKKRWKIANVQLGYSYGMFDQNKLVGFIINAIGDRNGQMIAFNTGTGVIPRYRGKRIVASLYEYAIPKLKEDGVSLCMLEVIKANIVAIKAYKQVGFKIIKNYKCYSGTLCIKDSINNYELKKVTNSYFDWDKLSQDHYSWDNHIETVKYGDYDYYIVIRDKVTIGYFVIDADSGYIPQLDVLIDVPVNWDCLFSAIESISKTIKINNVDERLATKIEYLNRFGLKNTVDQFEMELDLRL